MTKEGAVAKADTEWWKSASEQDIVDFQLNEPLLCMPFKRFREAVEKVLGRPVWTHEFAHPERLLAELRGDHDLFRKEATDGVLRLCRDTDREMQKFVDSHILTTEGQ